MEYVNNHFIIASRAYSLQIFPSRQSLLGFIEINLRDRWFVESKAYTLADWSEEKRAKPNRPHGKPRDRRSLPSGKICLARYIAIVGSHSHPTEDSGPAHYSQRGRSYTWRSFRWQSRLRVDRSKKGCNHVYCIELGLELFPYVSTQFVQSFAWR
jgi:hypothetical protein